MVTGGGQPTGPHLPDGSKNPLGLSCVSLQARLHLGQVGAARQASSRGLRFHGPLKQTLMRASAGRCGLDSAHWSSTTVRDVARMDCLGFMAHAESSEGVLLCASMLHRFCLSYDYAKLEDFVLLESCPYCSAPLRDPNQHPNKPKRSIFT